MCSFRNAAPRRWKAEGPLFPGAPVYHLAFDPRDGRRALAATPVVARRAVNVLTIFKRSTDLGLVA